MFPVAALEPPTHAKAMRVKWWGCSQAKEV